ncbi:MAG: GNAT family N-acetyltransferase [Candidatus Diapherotrites archaeon]|nr:GNAT family N-acetyltransferase [Candidatus Diapherotrites archaeon]
MRSTLPSCIGSLEVRPLERGDEKYLKAFADTLSANSKELFAPYRWDTDKQIEDYRMAIAGHEAGKDSSYLIFSPSGTPIGHLALWRITQKYSFNGKSLQIPILGICIADAFQGKGIGRLGMQFLMGYAQDSKADAIELTFAHWNERAKRLYFSIGFEDIGTLKIPLGVNPATQDVDFSSIKIWREERHCMYIINESKTSIIKSYLKSKQSKKV